MIEFASADLTAGQLNAIVKKLGGPERALMFLQGLLIVVMVSLKLALTKAFKPSEFIGENWSVWKGPIDGDGLLVGGEEDKDVREDDINEIDWGKKVEIVNFLRDKESYITGEENLLRQKQIGKIRLGGRAFLSIWGDYQAKKAEGKSEESVLENLRLTKGVKFISFFGLILRAPDGKRCVLYLCWNGGEWFWDCDWLDGTWYAGNFSAVLASVK
jgi:hypothetical protein